MKEELMDYSIGEQIRAIKKFSGSDNADVVKWLHDVEEIFDRFELKPFQKYLTVQSFLINTAELWFRFNKSTICDWSSFKVEIVKAFRSSCPQALLTMSRRQQLPGESVMEYYDDKIHLCQQSDPHMSSNLILHFLTKGLNNSLLPHVIRRHPTTPNDFLMMAQDEEQIQFTLNHLSHSSTTSADPYPNDDNTIDNMVAFVKQPVNINTRSFNSQQDQSSSQPVINLSPAPIQSSDSPMSINMKNLHLEIQNQCTDETDDWDKLKQQHEFGSVKTNVEDTFEVIAGSMGSIPADDTLINSGNYNEEDDEISEGGDFKEDETSEDGDFNEGEVSEGDSDVGAGVIVIPQDVQYLWSGKYRPRNPRVFKKVYTGYDWIQYNKKYYDTDNPISRIIQAYKLVNFYPDLIDQIRTPYEDIAFRIVIKAWNYSYHHESRCYFQNGLFPLCFYFLKWKYRRSLFLLLFSFMKMLYFIFFSFLCLPGCLLVRFRSFFLFFFSHLIVISC
jgi:hypothetical protein